ncbi:hypothetical protein NC652_029930 [Populus alba x Populus x berolinensis]|nr:hypothetical protein NC652_029930 [Populus alba x Populus x berolinensis]
MLISISSSLLPSTMTPQVLPPPPMENSTSFGTLII